MTLAPVDAFGFRAKFDTMPNDVAGFHIRPSSSLD